eukprot:24326_1
MQHQNIISFNKHFSKLPEFLLNQFMAQIPPAIRGIITTKSDPSIRFISAEMCTDNIQYIHKQIQIHKHKHTYIIKYNINNNNNIDNPDTISQTYSSTAPVPTQYNPTRN